MIFQKLKAEEFCESVRDGTHDTPKRTKTGYKLITWKNIKQGRINLEDTYYISEKDYLSINKRSLVEKWDVLMSMIGTVGESAIVKNIPDYAIKNIALFKCGNSELKGKWLNYYLHTPMAQNQMLCIMRGSSQQFLSLEQIRNLYIPTCNENDMQKIVGFLSAYDELIEVNQKQIRLLEEAARRLYREWFVALRFPGHEDTPITNGIPAGWTKTILNEIVQFRRGKTITQEQTIRGSIPVIAGGREPAYFHNMSNTEAPVITVSASGANAGFTQIHYQKIWASDCSFADDTSTSHLYFAYCFLKQSHSLMSNLQKGSAQPHVYAKDINHLPLLLPPQTLIQEFENAVIPFFHASKNCLAKIKLATEARDRLLPKLMNGEIEV